MEMSEKTLEKTYEPKNVEEKWSESWISSGLNTPELPSKKPPFSMVIPPPNITGALHLGHALNSTLQDILARYKRMKGFNVLWLPGIDHAGIATQNVVERKLAEEGLNRHGVGREEFVKRVWKWKEESGGTIIKQLKRLGASCDWTRLRFTMDSGLSKAVREVFARLYSEGLIYRGDYIINWCPRCDTALSDLEVQFEETAGKLYYMEYPLKEPVAGITSLVVATTRPETMLGDTAVAVNPEDDRYKALIGSAIRLPLAGRDIPIIGDPSVSIEFGTGAVKITPAHDFNDFEMSRRHNLPALKIMGQNAVMNENAGEFKGLDRFKARKKVIEGLEGLGLLKKVEDYKIMLGACYRCGTIVEPTLSKQWFVKVTPLAGPAIKAVEDGETRFIPKGWENTYFDWMRNIRDWCISRQIWWGHRIPAWHCKDGHVTVAAVDPVKCSTCGNTHIEQDPDVLDTWFSSALWPFSTLGWPDKTEELKAFYPTSVLSTSFDIIFFWVARMMMMGKHFMGTEPFRDVYIHALIRDAEGQKMSKSKGNVIDPLIMMEKYGTDAFRFTLAVLAAQGRDIKLAEERIAGYRNFCNKIWNLARFTLMNLEPGYTPGDLAGESLGMADKWILTRRNVCITEASKAIEEYKFDEAARVLYRFVWHDLCDWYVELSKQDLKGENGPDRKIAAAHVLIKVFKDTLKMLHPIMPFMTEELFSYLPLAADEEGKSLMALTYPALGMDYPEEAALMENVMDLIRAVRNIRTDMNVPQDARTDCVSFSKDARLREVIQANEKQIMQLAKVRNLTISESGTHPKDSVSAIAAGGVEVFVPLAEHIDFDVEAGRLKKELDKLASEYDGVRKKLENPEFVNKAPAEVVEKEKARAEGLLEKRAKLEKGLERITGARGTH